MALTASLSGYIISLFVNNLFTKNIMLYIGTAPLFIIETILPFLAAFIIAAIVIIFCMIVLRRFKKISAVEAIRMGNTGGDYAINDRLALYKNKIFNSSIFLGLRDVVLRFKTYIILSSLFIKMLIAKDMSGIAIMRSIGISSKDIKIQYITKALLVLNLGIVTGTIMANTLGQKLLSAMLSIVGASKIEFIINPLKAYVLSPIIMMFIVTVTTLLSIKSIRQYSVRDINVE
jgi:ABC-type antimicrobial peptide transport system permease subunit